MVDVEGEGEFETSTCKEKEKRVIRKHAITWENKAPSNQSGGRGGWRDLSAEQDKEKRFW